MTRTNRFAPAALLIAALAMVGSTLAAAPAFAASPGATPTLTITADDVLKEYPMLGFSGGCPATSTAVRIITPTMSQITPVLDGAADFIAPVGYYSGNWGDPRLGMTFTVICTVGGVDSPSMTATYTSPTYGSAVTTSATPQIDLPFAISGTCGTAPGVYGVVIQWFGPDGAQLDSSFQDLPSGGAFSFSLGTPASYGYVVGDTAVVGASCATPVPGGGTVYYTSAISTEFTIAAAPVVPAPVILPPASSLPKTGVDATAPLGAALLLLAGGVIALGATRRRTREG